MVWKVTTPPATEPITLDEARRHLRIDTTDFDQDITDAIASAREYVELITNRGLMPQTWQIDLPAFGAGATLFPANIRSLNGILYQGSAMSQWTNEPVLLPANVTELASVQYYDFENALQSLTVDTDYLVRFTEPPQLVPVLYWPLTYRRPDAVKISASVGYTDAANIPGPIKSALKLQVQLLVSRPVGSELDALERARDSLLAPYVDGNLLV